MWRRAFVMDVLFFLYKTPYSIKVVICYSASEKNKMISKPNGISLLPYLPEY